MKHTIFGRTYYIDKVTGQYSQNLQELKSRIVKSLNYDKLNITLDKYNISSVTFCINLSNACNLACDYCFNDTKNGTSISLNSIKQFLDSCFNLFSNKEKYYVDLSGKGEPLLFLSKILEIKKYCDSKSNELKREILVQFVCNGTLLSIDVANILQKNGILFGVSIDGNKFIHNKHRKTKNGKNTYKNILKNVKNIRNHEYVGAACTLTKDVFSLKNSLVNLSKTFKTISYKPSRNCPNSIDCISLQKWLKEYDKLTIFF